LYGTYYVKNFYIDAIGTYAQRDYTTVRNLRYSVPKFAQDPTPSPVTNVNQSFVGDPGARDYDLFVGVGYNYYRQGFNLTPYLNVRYIDSQIDGYTERNQNPNTNSGFGLPLAVEEQSITSFTSRLGGQLAYAVATQAGVLTPYVRFDWEHEFKNNERTFQARFASVGPQYDGANVIGITTDAPDQDYFNLGLGMSATFPRGVMAYIDYATLLGLADTTAHRLAAGIRYEF
jgi:outer membrane autotransporter protein